MSGVNEKEARMTRSRKIAKLIEQWDKAVRYAVQVSRKDKRLSQETVADRMAWSVDVMANMEQGRRDITVAEFIVLAQQIGVDPETMFRRVVKF